MKIRRDPVFISSLLFTIALLWLMPPFFKIAFEPRDKEAFQRLDWALQAYSREIDVFSIAALAIILIGLIVIWGGYVKKVRWTWFVMVVIVWGWFFPALAFRDFIFPLYSGALQISGFSALFLAAFGLSGPQARGIVHEMLIFALMVIALVLPMKAFFWERGRALPGETLQSDVRCSRIPSS